MLVEVLLEGWLLKKKEKEITDHANPDGNGPQRSKERDQPKEPPKVSSSVSSMVLGARCALTALYRA